MSESNNGVDQSKHLESATNQLKQLVSEITNLNNELVMKREQALKLQGIVEYLQSIGIESPKQSENPESIEVSNP